MTPLYARSFEVCYGVGMALSGEIGVEVFEVILDSREKAEDEAWNMQTAKRVREIKQKLKF